MRNLGLIVALWLAAVLPTNSLALGLGEIEVKSFLNQPLNAEIEVLSARPGEIDDLLVSLASREAFTRAGLERPRNLSELRFTVQKNEAGDSAVIKVTSRTAIKEPFLNFLVEADWSKGRLLREFTVLLDPPFYADQPPPADTVSQQTGSASTDDGTGTAGMSTPAADDSSQPAASGETVTEPIALSAGTSGEQTTSPPASSEYVADESENIIEGDVLVVKGDTLWSIASRYKDDDHSMAQVMLAFQRANPNAFHNGNINNMKSGAVLRAPSASELNALGKQAAYAEVLKQNGLWDEYVARVSGVSPAVGGSKEGTAASGDSTETGSGELSLLVPAEGSSDSAGSGDSADIDQLRTKLALAEEELEASRIENKELASRIAELQERVSKFEELQKMVEIQDDSLAAIQAGQSGDEAVGESQDGMADEPAVGEGGSTDAVNDSIQADEEALLEELLAEEAAAQAEEEAASKQDGMAGSETQAVDEMVDDQVATADTGGDQMVDDDAEPAATATTPPAPVIVTEPTTSPGSGSMLDGILPPGITDMIPSMGGIFADPIILAAIGGVIVLLLVLVMLKRRKAAQDEESGIGEDSDDSLFASDDEEEMTPIHLAESEDPLETDIDVPSEDDMAPAQGAADADDDDDPFGSTEIVSAIDMPEPEAPAPAEPAAAEQDDVLNEVDVYLAYGLYDNAEDLLNTSLAENPDRADYRSKLLDTYFATKNVNAFVKEAENLKSMGDAANSYWDRVQIMGYELAPDNALFSDAKDSGLSAADLEIAKPQEADFDLGGDDEDTTGFSTTDFDLSEEGVAEDLDATPGVGEAGDLESTQQVSASSDAAVEDEMPDLPDDIGGELEFSMDDAESDAMDDAEGDAEVLSDDALELPDDLDFDIDDAADEKAKPAAGQQATSDEAEADEVALDFDMDADLDDDLDLDDDALEIRASEDDVKHQDNAVVTPNFEETAVMDMDDDQAAAVDDSADADDSAIDLGMEDTAMKEAEALAEETGEMVLDDADTDDDEDISIIDFGGEDFVEPTDMADSTADDDDSDDDDAFVIDDDEDGEESIRTGTFAPGDFEEPTEAVESIADIEDMDDLMLPDDVDEVSTKLDLARAFIDMGDTEGARGSLEEVMSEGNAEQKAEARALLDQI